MFEIEDTTGFLKKKINSSITLVKVNKETPGMAWKGLQADLKECRKGDGVTRD